MSSFGQDLSKDDRSLVITALQYYSEQLRMAGDDKGADRLDQIVLGLMLPVTRRES